MRRGLAKRHGPAARENLDVPRCPAEHRDVRLLEERVQDYRGLKEVWDKMFEKKFGARANRYLADLRRQEMIE
jgi:hypothetical protein